MTPINLEDYDLRKNGLKFPETRIETPTVKSKRDRRYIPTIPARVFVKLIKLPRRTWAVYLVALLRSRLNRSKTVPLATCFLNSFGLTKGDKAGALPRLERAGLLRVEQRGKRNPLVTILDAPVESETK